MINYKPSDNFENIINSVEHYLLLNKLYINRNYQNYNLSNQNINPQNNNIPNQQILQTANTTVETHQGVQYQPQNNGNNNQNPQQQINNIRNIPQNNNTNQYATSLNNDKWLESFHINDFKLFIFYRKFFDEFYSSLRNNISNINNINLQDINNNINLNDIKNMKDKLQEKLNISKENIELMHSITYSFFENFYCFTLFFLKEYKVHYEYYFKKGYFNYLNSIYKEINEYFVSSHNFYFNLRSFEDLKKVKTEQIECILNDKEKDKNKNKILTLINNIFIVYPDIILSGFLFFFQCDEIVEKYYHILLDLFFLVYRYFCGKFYEPLLEHLLNKIMSNKLLKDKNEDKNKFMLEILIKNFHFSYFFYLYLKWLYIVIFLT
jgi:hypothetical protein